MRRRNFFVCWVVRRVAARRARAAGKGRPRRLLGPCLGVQSCSAERGVSYRLARARLDRGKKRCHRIPLGRRQLRPAAGNGGRTGSSQSRCPRDTRRGRVARCQTCDVDDPIVVTAAGDLVEFGLAESLSRPGGNITGLSLFVAELMAKRLELVKEAVPDLVKAAVLLNADNASTPKILQEIERDRPLTERRRRTI